MRLSGRKGGSPASCGLTVWATQSALTATLCPDNSRCPLEVVSTQVAESCWSGTYPIV